MAITLLLQGGGALLGAAGSFISLFSALPAAYACMRGGGLVGGGIVLGVCGALSGAFGFWAALGYLLQFGLASLFLPLLLRRGMAWDKAVLVSSLAIVAGILATLAGYAVRTGQTVLDLVEVFVKQEFDKAMAVYEKADLSVSQMAELRELAQQMADLLLLAYPGLIFTATGALLLLLVVFLARLSRGDYPVPGTVFRDWKISEMMIWPLILAGFVVFFSHGLVQQIAVNLLIVLLPLYFLQGLAIVSSFFHRRNISPALRGLGYLMILFVAPIPYIVTGIGVFDLWVDFRKPRNKKS